MNKHMLSRIWLTFHLNSTSLALNVAHFFSVYSLHQFDSIFFQHRRDYRNLPIQPNHQLINKSSISLAHLSLITVSAEEEWRQCAQQVWVIVRIFFLRPLMLQFFSASSFFRISRLFSFQLLRRSLAGMGAVYQIWQLNIKIKKLRQITCK